MGDLLEVELLRASGWSLRMDELKGTMFAIPSEPWITADESGVAGDGGK